MLSFPTSPVAPPRIEPTPGHQSRPPEGDALPSSSVATLPEGPTTLPPKSYSGALTGAPSMGHPPSQPWICVGENDIVSTISDGVRALQLSSGFKEKLCRPWSNSVIVRLIGKTIGYSFMCNRLRSMWKPQGQTSNFKDGEGLVDPTTADSYGPWLTVTRKGRRPRSETYSEKGKSPRRNLEGSADQPKSAGVSGKATLGKNFSLKGKADPKSNSKGNNGDSSNATGGLIKERRIANGSDKAQVVQMMDGPELTTPPSVKMKNKGLPTETARKTPKRPTSSKATDKAPAKAQVKLMEPATHPGSVLRSEPPDPMVTLDPPLSHPQALFPIPLPLADQEPRQPKIHRRAKPKTKSLHIPPSAKPKKAAKKKDFFDDGVKKNLRDWLPPTPPAPMDLAVDLPHPVPIVDVEASTCTEMITGLDEQNGQTPRERSVWDLNSPLAT
ncbi:hypothetical protein LINPERHAP1_LOCUS19556 [Linum perenne]